MQIESNQDQTTDTTDGVCLLHERSYTQSRELQVRAHQLIPGGCHTYAKGDDQFPQLSPGFIARGQGCRVWDVDGNEFIEYGMGCRAVTLGHAYAPVVEAAREEMRNGTNFTRPAAIEVECAEVLSNMVPGADMVKFAKDGSAVTSAALKLARAFTGRDHVAICADHPFFSTHDWFIGTTALDAGIPQAVKDLSLTFRYNDIDSVRALFKERPNQIAALILEPAKYEDPRDDFLHKVKDLCHEHGALFIIDEMITGFRWHNGGAQTYYGVTGDLSAYGMDTRCPLWSDAATSWSLGAYSMIVNAYSFYQQHMVPNHMRLRRRLPQ